MPEVYSRSSDALLRRLLSRKGFTTEQRRSLLRRVSDRGSVYLAPINAVYVRQFGMTSAAEDATRFLHQACRGLPNLINGKAATRRSAPNGAPVAALLDQDGAFYAAVFEHALAFFGSRILYPARRALRDADIADLFDVTREDLEHQTSLPFADAVEVLDFLTLHRANDPPRRRVAHVRPRLHRTQVRICRRATRISRWQRSLRRIPGRPHDHRRLAQTLLDPHRTAPRRARSLCAVKNAPAHRTAGINSRPLLRIVLVFPVFLRVLCGSRF
jgi:hypothetical protein